MKTPHPHRRSVRTASLLHASVLKWLTIDTGYSQFFAGDYLRDTGPHDDADFGYVQAQLLF